MPMETKRYYELKAKGICTCCGKAKAREGRTTCQKCHDTYKKNAYISLDKPVIKPRENTGYTIEEIAVMCKERGVSYGVMVAILDGKMKDPVDK